MGVTSVPLTIKNPFNPTKKATGEFLVDSGAHFTVLPAAMVKALRLKPAYSQRFALADGRIMERPVGNATVRLDDREIIVPVVLGESGDGALLGVTTLESFGLMLDPFKRKLYHSKLMLA